MENIKNYFLRYTTFSKSKGTGNSSYLQEWVIKVEGTLLFTLHPFVPFDF